MNIDQRPMSLDLKEVGVVRSTLKRKEDCPLQGDEGAPEAWIHINDQFKDALEGLTPGDSILLFTWFHLADRETLKCYPRNNYDAPYVGVFTTRSPDRPNPIGLHRVKILEVQNLKLKVHPLEALDGTIVIDLKPVLSDVTER